MRILGEKPSLLVVNMWIYTYRYISLINIFFIDNIMPMITLLIMIMIILKTLRFVPLHSAEASPETWTLKIQRPELSDAGEYECQVDAMDMMIVLKSSI